LVGSDLKPNALAVDITQLAQLLPNCCPNCSEPGDSTSRTPMVGNFGCCARATSGQVAAEPTVTLMKSRRLIAFLERLGTAPITMRLQQGFATREMGYRLNCAAKFLNCPRPVSVTSRYSGTRPGVIVVRSHLLRPEQALQFGRVITDRLHIIGGDLQQPASALAMAT
jgi:hypothetical protein